MVRFEKNFWLRTPLGRAIPSGVFRMHSLNHTRPSGFICIRLSGKRGSDKPAHYRQENPYYDSTPYWRSVTDFIYGLPHPCMVLIIFVQAAVMILNLLAQLAFVKIILMFVGHVSIPFSVRALFDF